MADTVDSGTYTPQSLALRQKLAQQLLGSSLNGEPIRHWAQGLAQMGKAALGGYLGYQANEEEKQGRADAAKQVAAALSGNSAAPSSQPLAPQTSADPASAIASIESGGKYDAVGPTTANGDKAYGKYQVMGNNIPSWTKTHLGESMTPDQFLSNPDAQDAVFKGQFGQYQKKYGPEGAARAWFAGEGGMNNPNAKDTLGTSVSDYANRFTKALGFNGAPQDNAQLPPNATPTQGILSNNQASPLDGAAYPAGPVGAPSTPPNAQPTQGQLSGSPAGLGTNPNTAKIAAILTNPWIDPSVKSAIISQAAPSYGFQTLPDGTIIRTNPKSGQVEPVYQSSKPTFGVIGKDKFGNDVHGFIDATKGTVKPATPNGGPIAASQGAVDPNVTGQAYLETLPKPEADQVKAMVEGRLQPPGSFALKTPYWQQMLQSAAQYEPGFDFTKWGERTATAKDFASGKAAQNVTAMNTVVGHLGDLAEKADALGNFRLPLANTIGNTVSNASGDPRVNNFRLARNAVADEMAKVFRSSGMSDHEIQQWKSTLSEDMSPDQLKGAVKTGIGLMESRLSALADQRSRGMSTQIGARDLLNDKSKATLQKVEKWANGEAVPSNSDPVADEMRRRGLLK